MLFFGCMVFLYLLNFHHAVQYTKVPYMLSKVQNDAAIFYNKPYYSFVAQQNRKFVITESPFSHLVSCKVKQEY
jgi:hypothetical protein